MPLIYVLQFAVYILYLSTLVLKCDLCKLFNREMCNVHIYIMDIRKIILCNSIFRNVIYIQYWPPYNVRCILLFIMYIWSRWIINMYFWDVVMAGVFICIATVTVINN